MKFAYGKTTIKKKFALLPHFCQDGHWFWLESYYRVKSPIKDTQWNAVDRFCLDHVLKETKESERLSRGVVERFFGL